MELYRAKDFGVIQSIYRKGDNIFIKDYLENIFNFEDVTDDGEIFNTKTGWVMYFFSESDITIIREIAKKTTVVYDVIGSPIITNQIYEI